eukprot:3383990-Pleurochrysis_carterae.AAC.1
MDAVRMKANGQFLRVVNIYKPLQGFLVQEASLDDEKLKIERDDPVHAITLARQPRYFGANP